MSEKQKQKIFIVEDDTDLAEMLSAYFRVQGYHVSNATRGEDAVEQIREELPDIAVLDIRLPDIDGYEVCRRLRNERRTQYLPVIFLTEKRERDDKLGGLELGAVDYITKPFDIQELRLRVRNALRRSQLSTLLNPVTNLPEGMMVRERVNDTLKQGKWGTMLVRIKGLNKFRDRFGFVAADDVSRAVTLMVDNAVKELDGEAGFVGHIGDNDFIILSTPNNAKTLAQRCEIRLRPSIQYFYPALERSRIAELPESERLDVQIKHVTSEETAVSTLDDLFAVLVRMQT